MFLDDENIYVGDSISQALSNAISECHGMIVVFSAKYTESEWCKKEILQAASSGEKNLYPIRRQDIKYDDLLNFHLGDLKWVDIFEDKQYDNGLEKLGMALEKV